MQTIIKGAPAFAHLHVELEPGETLITESGAMAVVDADVSMKAKFNGGFFGGLLKKWFGGESLFVAHWHNSTPRPRLLVLTCPTPGDLVEYNLDGNEVYLQPGAFVACEPGVKLGIGWAGFASWFAREGLFRLRCSGRGRVWFGAYGAIVSQAVRGQTIVDTGHLVAYTPGVRLGVGLVGGLWASLTSGEGFITRVKGQGTIWLQTRSLDGLARWINPRLR